ncbi:hypothetical protein OTU49_003262, partial [Cherax quadricarinatus]
LVTVTFVVVTWCTTDVSVERQDSTTDYAADNSSAEQSSTGTPLNMSPRRGHPFLTARHDTSGVVITTGGESGDQGSVPSGVLPGSLTPSMPLRVRQHDARSHSLGLACSESETS